MANQYPDLKDHRESLANIGYVNDMILYEGAGPGGVTQAYVDMQDDALGARIESLEDGDVAYVAMPDYAEMKVRWEIDPVTGGDIANDSIIIAKAGTTGVDIEWTGSGNVCAPVTYTVDWTGEIMINVSSSPTRYSFALAINGAGMLRENFPATSAASANYRFRVATGDTFTFYSMGAPTDEAFPTIMIHKLVERKIKL